MSCGGRIYKGDTVYVSVPFDVEGYSALTISFFTNGEYKITRTEEEVTIEDGFITAVFEGHDLDVLPDGVLRYTIECEVEGEEYVDSSNTMFYLKTPKDYDAADVQDFYNSGWTEGFASGLTQGFPDGYESGHTDGYNEAYPIAWNAGHESGYTEGRARGWQDGVSWEQGQIAQQAISLSFSANGEWQKDFFDDIYANRVVVNVDIPMFTSIFVSLQGTNISIAPEDILSINNFEISGITIVNRPNSVGIYAYGKGRKQAGGANDRIVITCDNSAASQWELTGCELVAYNATQYDPYDSGIQIAPVDFSVAHGAANTTIIIKTYN